MHQFSTLPLGSYTNSNETKTNLHQVNENIQITDTNVTGHIPSNEDPQSHDDFFMGYRRNDQLVGIRNEIWIIPTVGCVNPIARALEKQSQSLVSGTVEAIRAFPHSFGCSQTGDDLVHTRKILSNLISHPNAGGVLVIGLGCESNPISSLVKELGDFPKERIRFLDTQNCDDEIEEGMRFLKELAQFVSGFVREPISCSKLIIGMKSGASSGRSILNRNSFIQLFTNLLLNKGGTAILTEVPKDSFIDFHSTNSPNANSKKKQTKTTHLEPITVIKDVLSYGEKVKVSGVNILSSPENDPVAATALAASGAHMILFSSSLGSPFSAPVPTIKIVLPSENKVKKTRWIDFTITEDMHDLSPQSIASHLFNYILLVASGTKVSTEEAGFHDIAIWKQGATL